MGVSIVVKRGLSALVFYVDLGPFSLLVGNLRDQVSPATRHSDFGCSGHLEIVAFPCLNSVRKSIFGLFHVYNRKEAKRTTRHSTG